MSEMTSEQIDDRSARIAEAHLLKDEESNAKMMGEMVQKRIERATYGTWLEDHERCLKRWGDFPEDLLRDCQDARPLFEKKFEGLSIVQKIIKFDLFERSDSYYIYCDQWTLKSCRHRFSRQLLAVFLES